MFEKDYVIDISVYVNDDGTLPKTVEVTSTIRTLFQDTVRARSLKEAEKKAVEIVFSNPENLKYDGYLFFF